MSNLKELRRARGLKQSDLAEYLEMTGATYSRYESGKYRLNQDLLVKLVQYFNVSADYLIGITNNPVSPVRNYVAHENKSIEQYLLNERVSVGNKELSKKQIDKIVHSIKYLVNEES